MTKSEYFEKNNVSFAEAMKLFNEQKKFKSFDKFLASEHYEPKFKVGDLVVIQLNERTRNCGFTHNEVFEIKGCDRGWYIVKVLTPDCNGVYDYTCSFNNKFLDENCVLY